MAGAWSQFSPGSPPSDEIRKVRAGILKVLAETWDEYMRTPQFMEMMKASLNGALDLKRMPRDGTNRVHVQFENPSKEDIDGCCRPSAMWRFSTGSKDSMIRWRT
jgi:hypothetical protein